MVVLAHHRNLDFDNLSLSADLVYEVLPTRAG